MVDAERDALMRRITTDPDKLCGKPIIRGKRLAVEHVLGILASGEIAEGILRGYDWLEPDDIRACLLYAAEQIGNVGREQPIPA